mgnify:CR=1 FL=1
MAVRIVPDLCIGCGECETLYPGLFEMRDDGKAHVREVDDYDENLAGEAEELCPVDAIVGE